MYFILINVQLKDFKIILISLLFWSEQPYIILLMFILIVSLLVCMFTFFFSDFTSCYIEKCDVFLLNMEKEM